jgi:CubicO group peptidase (beta-lactamase class C family)
MATQAAKVVDRHVQAGVCAGAGVVVIKDGEIVLEHYAGEAAPAVPAARNVLWPLASISKVYTATMIMRLVEEGVLTLNTPVCEVIPQFRGEGKEEVRLRHLLTHTAGMIYEPPEMAERLKAQTPISVLLEEAYASPLLFKPGTALSYADYHYLIAGHMAEIAAGKSYPELMRTLVFEAAELRDSFVPPRCTDEHRLADVRGVMAEGTDGAMYNSRYARELAHPAFGVFASASDLARFGMLFAPGGPRILSEAGVRTMTTNQTGNVPGQPPLLRGYAADLHMPWAIGFALQTEQVPSLYCDLASSRSFAHGGATGCALVIDPTYNLIVAVVSNAHSSLGVNRWYMRLHSIINAAFAQFTMQAAPVMAEA